MYNTKNYTEQGGDKTVIGGALDLTGAVITGVVTAAVVNNLTTTAAGNALDAAQGKALKTLIDAKYTAANATTAVAGTVKQSAKVATAAGATPTKAEFDALITAMVTAGLMSAT